MKWGRDVWNAKIFFCSTGPQNTGLFGTPAQPSPFGSTAAGTSTAGTGELYQLYTYNCIRTVYTQELRFRRDFSWY